MKKTAVILLLIIWQGIQCTPLPFWVVCKNSNAAMTVCGVVNGCALMTANDALAIKFETQTQAQMFIQRRLQINLFGTRPPTK